MVAWRASTASRDFFLNVPVMTNTEWLAQSLGVAAFLISLAGYISPNDRRLKVMLTSGTAILTLHFMLFGAWLAAVSLILNTGRTWLSIYRRGTRVFVAIALAQLTISLPMVDSMRDMLPVVGSVIGSYGLLCLSGQWLRMALLITTGFWFVNNLLLWSIGAMMLDCLNAGAHIYAIHRIGRLSTGEAGGRGFPDSSARQRRRME